MLAPMSEQARASTPIGPPRRRKFLLIVDGSPESKVAQRFAARRAQSTGGIVSLLRVVAPPDPQAWLGVEAVMRAEAWQEAEALLHEAARNVNRLTGLYPELIVREGRLRDEIVALIREDPMIAILVLGAGTGGEGPGPLVAAAAGPMANAFPIPVTIVPGRLTTAEVDALA